MNIVFLNIEQCNQLLQNNLLPFFHRFSDEMCCITSAVPETKTGTLEGISKITAWVHFHSKPGTTNVVMNDVYASYPVDLQINERRVIVDIRIGDKDLIWKR